jgi:diguanylate cyclase
MPTSPRELLAEAAATGEDLETVARGQLFHIPEDISLPWSEGVCRFVVEGGPNYTNDAQKSFPKSSVARLLEIRTFVSYPVFAADGHWFGTLCGASKDLVQIEQEILDLMRECALLIGQRITPAESV